MMKLSRTKSGDPERLDAPADEFSLVSGGALYQLLLRAGLVRRPLRLLRRRMLVMAAVAWLPLLVLTLVEGHALDGIRVPFLFDIEAYARFLVALPILLLAELVIHRELKEIVVHFRESGIVPASALPAFEQAVVNVVRRRDAVAVEVFLLAMVFLIGPWAWQNGLALKTDTWYASVESDRTELTRAGWWFVYVSAPLFQFLLLRWYFRIGLWWHFLWKVSRLPLALRPAHPDRAGGLDFLGNSISAFVPVMIAQSVVAAGMIASRVVTGASGAIDFRGAVAMLIVVLIAMTIIPLLFFSPGLVAARRIAVRKYDRLAMAYVRQFEGKWMEGGAPVGETLLGSADIQSLADLGGSTDVVRGIWPFPFGWREFFQLVLAVSVPFFPLLLTVIPFGELVRDVVGMLL